MKSLLFDATLLGMLPLRVVLMLAVVVLVTQAAAQPRFEVPETSGTRWFKGNTHAHTERSDGDSAPDVVARWYKKKGYNFLVLSDHNFFVDPKTLSEHADSAFLLIPGEEISATFGKKPIHVNGLNIPYVIAPQSDSTLVGTVQKNVDAVRVVAGVPHINHPNFRWALDKETLLKVHNYSLLEIFNGHPLVNNLGGGGNPSLEEIWDYLLSNGKRVYGIAVDDAHHFKEEFAPGRSNPGRGWIMVRASGLNAEELLRRLEAGDFYASTGVVLDDVRIEPQSISITMHQLSDEEFRTEFIGREGKVLHVAETNPVRYSLRGNELYVRAKVTDSNGRVAWIQPVFVQR